jgi:peptidoglycan hydrolase-like protein with peptidoglycan-binding domain
MSSEEEIKQQREAILLGAENSQVKVLQGLLGAHSSPTLRVDGVFGPSTLSAVQEYQMREHLPVSDALGHGADRRMYLERP